MAMSSMPDQPERTEPERTERPHYRATPPVDEGHTVEWYIERGYARISSRYRIIARIDRPDWLAIVVRLIGAAWTDRGRGMRRTNQEDADYYRRCVSRDRLTVGRAVFKQIPASMDAPYTYRRVRHVRGADGG